MAKRSHPLRKRTVRVHHTMVNYIMPVGLAIIAVLVAYWAQSDGVGFHQYFQYVIAVVIMFVALYILKEHPKHLFE